MAKATNSITVLDAVGKYVANLKPKAGAAQTEHHKQLLHFAMWCGDGSKIWDISPSKVGEYGQQANGGSQSPERLQEVKKFLAFARQKEMTPHNLAIHLRFRKSRLASKRRTGEERRADVIELTQEGHENLVNELAELKSQRGPIAEQIRKAAADKDIRENVPLEAARENLGQVESRIQVIENTLRDSRVLSAAERSKSTVELGSQVWLKDADSGRESSFTVVSALEAKPLEGKVSDESPVGKAVIKQREGRKVIVQTPRGETITYIIRRVA